MTLALDPFGPFFWGTAWYVHVKFAWEQLAHGYPGQRGSAASGVGWPGPGQACRVLT